MQLLDLFSRHRRLEKRQARELYDLILKGALNVHLYEQGLAKDTFDGRFEQVSLHGGLMLRALNGRARTAHSQRLTDIIFSGFDHAYREKGIGDSSISRKVRKLAERFYVLAQGLSDGLDVGDDQALKAFIDKNGLANESPDHLVSYLRRADKGLRQIDELSMAKWPEM